MLVGKTTSKNIAFNREKGAIHALQQKLKHYRSCGPLDLTAPRFDHCAFVTWPFPLS
jgi:hypothetical protein